MSDNQLEKLYAFVHCHEITVVWLAILAPVHHRIVLVKHLDSFFIHREDSLYRLVPKLIFSEISVVLPHFHIVRL